MNDIIKCEVFFACRGYVILQVLILYSFVHFAEFMKMMIIIMMFISITCILIFTISKKKNKKASHANMKKKKERLLLKFHNIIPGM